MGSRLASAQARSTERQALGSTYIHTRSLGGGLLFATSLVETLLFAPKLTPVSQMRNAAVFLRLEARFVFVRNAAPVEKLQLATNEFPPE